MKNHLLREGKIFAGRLLIAVVILQNFAFALPAANAAEQTSYRWRNDNGNETTATWAAAQNTSADVLRGTPERLRMAAQHETADGDVSTALRLNSGDDAYYSSAIDGTDLYVGTAESPGRILKFDTTSGPPYSAPASIALGAGENNIYALFLDVPNDFGYAVTSTIPSKIIKFQISTFTRVDDLTLNAGDDFVGGGVLSNGYLYLVARTNPGALVKVELSSFTRVFSLALADDLTYYPVNPVVNDNKLYIADGNTQVDKFDITNPATTDPSYVTSVSIPTPGSPYNSALYTYVYGLAVDTVNDELYTGNYYGLVHKIDITGGTTFTYNNYLPVSASAQNGVMAIDESNGKLYIGSYNPYVSKVDLASFTQDAYNVALINGNMYSMQISADGSTLYTPVWYTPGHISEIATSDLSDTEVYVGATFGDGYLYSSVVDTATNTGYFGTGGNDRIRGDSIIQVDLATMTRTARLDLPNGYESLGTAAIDVVDRYAYFIDNNAPSHLIRVHLDSFPTYDVLTLPADGPYYYHYDAMAIDPNPAHHYLYLGSYGVPSVITQVDLNTFTRGSTLELSSSPMEDRLYNSLAIDTVNDKLYAGAGSASGKVIRIDITGSNLTRNGVISTPGDAFAYAATVDEGAGFLYLATGGSHILKINIANGTTFAIVDSLYVGGVEDYVSNFGLDTANGILYAGDAGTPGKVFRVNLSPFSYDPADDILAPGGEEYIYTVSVDDTNGNMYYGSYQMPGLIVKVTGNPKRQLRLEYAPKVGTCATSTYSQVTGGNDWEPALSPNVTSGTATTNVAGGLTDPAATFKAGYFMSSSAQTPGIQLNTDQFTEVEYSIKAMPSALPGDYCFRMTDAGSVLATYTNYAEATLKSNDSTTSNSGALSTLTAGATSTVTIAFTLQNDFPTGTLTVTFPIEFTGITAPTASLGTCTLNTFGASGQTMTAEKSGCVAGDTVILTGGTVVNPALAGVYTITWTNDDPGYAIVAIVDSDQVNVNAQVSPTITFDLNTNYDNSTDSAPYSVPFGDLTPGTVKSSDNTTVNSIWANLTTNAGSGAVVSVLSENAALKSTSAPGDTIPNAAATMSAGSANYGLCVNSVSAGTGSFVRDTNYAALTTCAIGGTVNDVAALSSVAPDPILNSASGAVTTAVAQILVNANANSGTAAHSDYTDVLTFIATGTF